MIETKMSEKVKYYLVKIIAVVIFVYSGLLVSGSIYTFFVAGRLSTSFSASGNADMLSNLLVTVFLFTLNGIFGLIGSAGLFFFKKFAYYLTLLSLVLVWFLSSIQNQGIEGNLPALIIAAIFLFFLVYFRKFILEYRNQQTESNLS